MEKKARKLIGSADHERKMKVRGEGTNNAPNPEKKELNESIEITRIRESIR